MSVVSVYKGEEIVSVNDPAITQEQAELLELMIFPPEWGYVEHSPEYYRRILDEYYPPIQSVDKRTVWTSRS